MLGLQQLVSATDDGKHFDGEDAQLLLDQGTPRFYIMRLPRKGLSFDRITYHAKVSQCLGALPGHAAATQTAARYSAGTCRCNCLWTSTCSSHAAILLQVL